MSRTEYLIPTFNILALQMLLETNRALLACFTLRFIDELVVVYFVGGPPCMVQSIAGVCKAC